MIDHVKRSSSNNAGFFVLIVNILIFVPFLLFFFYTVAQVIPTLAVAADPDTPSYAQVPPTDLYSDTLPTYPQARPALPSSVFSLGFGLRPMFSQLLSPRTTDPDTPSYAPVPLTDLHSDTLPTHLQARQALPSSVFSLGFGLRPMFSLLYSLRNRFKAFAFFRGLSVFALIFVFETATAVLSIRLLPSLLAILPQILFPLTLVQAYTLWTHTVLTYPSAKTLWQRIPPFVATLRATGPALALFLTAKALLRFALLSVYGIDELRRQGDLNPRFLGALVLTGAGVEAVALVPAHMVLTRIQAGLLPADEKTVVVVDKSLRGDGNGGESEAVGIKEAWRTFGWRAWARLVVLYVQVFVVVVVGGGLVLAVDFVFTIVVSLGG